jgi:hypothetical protein
MSSRPDVPSPVDLWNQANGDRDEYRRLLFDHGMLVPGKAEPLPCGWTPGGRHEPPEHRVARQRTDEEQAALQARTLACASRADLMGAANRGRREVPRG